MLYELWTPTEVRLASMGSKVWTETTKECSTDEAERKARGLSGYVTTIASSAAQHTWPQKKASPLYTTAWMKVVESLLTLVDMEINADIRFPPTCYAHCLSHCYSGQRSKMWSKGHLATTTHSSKNGSSRKILC